MSDTGQPYLRPLQIRELESDRSVLEKQMTSPHIQDKPQVARHLRGVNKMLAEQTPPETTPDDRDRLDRERRELEEQIQVGMPSSEEMRKNPPGAVGKHQAWEKRVKRAVLRWKNVMLRLNRGNEDPDLANVERLRPNTSTLGMSGSQIEGKIMSFPSEAYKANFDAIEFASPAEAAPAEKPKRAKMKLSPEESARRSERMKLMHAQKKAEKPPETQPAA